MVITMGALGDPPEEIGHNVAAALVGTFPGIPSKCSEEEHAFLQVLRKLSGTAGAAAAAVAAAG